MRVAKTYELSQPEVELAIRSWLTEKMSISLDDSSEFEFAMTGGTGPITATVVSPLTQ